MSWSASDKTTVGGGLDEGAVSGYVIDVYKDGSLVGTKEADVTWYENISNDMVVDRSDRPFRFRTDRCMDRETEEKEQEKERPLIPVYKMTVTKWIFPCIYLQIRFHAAVSAEKAGGKAECRKNVLMPESMTITA